MKTEMCAFASAWAPERRPELGQKTVLNMSRYLWLKRPTAMYAVGLLIIPHPMVGTGDQCAKDKREKTSDV
jgi:hypothetical protein